MNLRAGGRFTEGGHEWEVIGRPQGLHGGKTMSVQVVRPGVPETEREAVWPAYERLGIRRRVPDTAR